MGEEVENGNDTERQPPNPIAVINPRKRHVNFMIKLMSFFSQSFVNG
jgi:hypothetical protein